VKGSKVSSSDEMGVEVKDCKREERRAAPIYIFPRKPHDEFYCKRFLPTDFDS
jgi:hypothetical protein